MGIFDQYQIDPAVATMLFKFHVSWVLDSHTNHSDTSFVRN